MRVELEMSGDAAAAGITVEQMVATAESVPADDEVRFRVWVRVRVTLTLNPNPNQDPYGLPPTAYPPTAPPPAAGIPEPDTGGAP